MNTAIGGFSAWGTGSELDPHGFINPIDNYEIKTIISNQTIEAFEQEQQIQQEQQEEQQQQQQDEDHQQLVPLVMLPGADLLNNGINSIDEFRNLDRPTGVCSSDRSDVVYISDSFNFRILSYNTTTKEIIVLAGDPNGQRQGHIDGNISDGTLCGGPRKLCCPKNASRFIYFCDAPNNAIRRIDTVDRTVSTIIGMSGTPGFVDGNDFSKIRINHPRGIACNADGSKLFISDTDNCAIRW